MTKGGTYDPPDLSSDTLYRVTLWPHRSLSRRHFRWLWFGLMLIFSIAALRFYLIGAWPAAIFILIDLFAVGIAFQLNYRSSRRHDSITLTCTDLYIEQVCAKGRRQHWRLEPYWARAQITEMNNENNQLVISCRDKKILVGSFLTLNERKSLYLEISKAINQWKHCNFNS